MIANDGFGDFAAVRRRCEYHNGCRISAATPAAHTIRAAIRRIFTRDARQPATPSYRLPRIGVS